MVSWWGENVTNIAEHFIWLNDMSDKEAAQAIAHLQIEVLIGKLCWV